MTTVEQFLESLGRGTAAAWLAPEDAGTYGFAEDWDTADAASNALLFPDTPKSPRTGTLAALRGGLVTDSSLRPRVSAIVGPGATIRGIAQLVHPVFVRAATASNPAPTVEEIAKALLVYGEFYVPVPAMTGYADGLRIPLPIEIDVSSGDWIVNGATLRLWAGTLDPARLPLVDQRPRRLAQPDPVAVTKDVEQFLKDQKTPLARGIHLLARVLTNPFREVFFVFEVFRQLEADTQARVELALSFFDNAVVHQMQLLASLTAGAAILRRLDAERRIIAISSPTWLTEAHKTQRARAYTLVTNAFAPGGVPTAWRELPETAQQLADQPGSLGARAVRADDPPAGRHRMVLGRDVLAGEMGSVAAGGKTFRGVAYDGRIDPADFIATNDALLNPPGDPTLKDRLRLLAKLAKTWDFMDAVAMRGSEVVSFGMLHWPAEDDLGLPSLLHAFAIVDRDAFDLFFGIHGLATSDGAMDAKGIVHVVLQRVQLDGTRVDLDTAAARRDFFGGSVAGAITTFRTEWAARLREAAIASPTFRAAQVWETSRRFERIVKEVGSLKVGTYSMQVSSVISSELGVALVLDAHASMPGKVKADVQAAINAVDTTLADDALDRAITAKYRDLRHTDDTPGRNKKIAALKLDPSHGSFVAW